MLSFQVVPTDHDATPQLESYERGREQLLGMSFRDFEDAIVDVIDRSVNRRAATSTPSATSTSIMVNRWNYGYAYELCSVRPVALRAGREAAAGPRPRAVQERLDRQQRLGRVRLHAQRDQRGLPRRCRTCPD